MNKKYNYIILILLLYLPFKGQAQFGSSGLTNARNIGLANTYTANSYGLYSVGVNPGLLNNNPGGEEISILFPSLTARGYGFNSTLSSFKYFAGIIDERSINRLDAETFIESITTGGVVAINAVIGFFSIGIKPSEDIGTFAFTTTDYIAASLYFPGFVTDALNNDDPLEGSVSLEEFTYTTWWIRSYALSYSRRLYYKPGGKVFKSMSGGASLKYYNGFVYQDILISTSVASSSQDTILAASFDATSRNSFSSDLTFLNFFQKDGKTPDNFLFPKAAGKRMGFDLGFSAELNKGVTIGLAMTDIGKLKWESNAGTRRIEASFAILGNLDETLIDSISADASISDREEGAFTIPLPTALRVGAAIQIDQLFRKFPGKMRLAFDFNKGLNNEPSNFLSPRYSFGMDYQPGKAAPIILSGISYNKLAKTDWALGLGYNARFMEFYISTMDMLSIISGSKLFSVSAIFNWKINYIN